MRARRLIASLGAALAAVAAIALVRDTAYNGHDFAVFWRARRALLGAEPLYSVARDGAAAFKYPPWIAPVFVPFALMPLEAAKWVWGLVQVASLARISWMLVVDGIAIVRVAVGLTLFWGLWATHALDGQIELPLLAAVLAIERAARTDGRWGAARVGALLWALSAKVFTLIAVFMMPLRGHVVRALLVAALAFAAMSVPAWRSQGYGNPAELVRAWAFAARSGGSEFAGEKIRGRDNQGLPALILRAASVPASNSRADLALAVLLAAAGAAVWARASRKLSAADRAAGWLGLAAAVHPLAWFHLFVFAFPLAVRSVDRAIASKRVFAWVLALAGAAMIAIVTRRTLGPVGEAFELASVKSWGVLACLAALLLCGPKASARSS